MKWRKCSNYHFHRNAGHFTTIEYNMSAVIKSFDISVTSYPCTTSERSVKHKLELMRNNLIQCLEIIPRIPKYKKSLRYQNVSCNCGTKFIVATVEQNSLLQPWTKIHCCNLGPKFIVATVDQNSLLQPWTKIPCCNRGPKFLVATVDQNSLLQPWTKIPCCNRGPKFLVATGDQNSLLQPWTKIPCCNRGAKFIVTTVDQN
ncbi:Hypothetical predicted protein [Octopus vulgaris]|uniref:Uncharacterized protein n=1 Tax=Octopus vulgaris TaxID=6645 RepID=A0AA36BBB0_OCTVU|nr:Hypothetical predicted protein [Octopus vulgaris]